MFVRPAKLRINKQLCKHERKKTALYKNKKPADAQLHQQVLHSPPSPRGGNGGGGQGSTGSWSWFAKAKVASGWRVW